MAIALTRPSPMVLFHFANINTVLNGTRFEYIDAVKVKGMKLMNKLSEDDDDDVQWKTFMDQCWDQWGKYIIDGDIFIM